MPRNMEHAPRRRPSHKEAPARKRMPERERGRTPERAAERKPRGRASERATERTSRSRTPERATKRKPYGRIPERERKRVSEPKTRGRASERTTERKPGGRTPARKTARTPERTTRRRVPAQETPRRRALARKTARVPERKRVVRRGRTRPGGFGTALSRLAILLLVLLAVGKIGDRFVFQELQVVHPDQIVSDAPPPEEEAAPQTPPKTFVSDRFSAASDILTAAPDRAAQKDRKDGFYTILLAGVDDHNGGSDTVILMSVDSKQHQIFGVSIPRDTKAVIDGKARKMNAAYKIGGMKLLAETISEQMSIPVDYTVEIDLAGFAAVIDAIGGVEFDVPIDMNYEDPAQDLEIHVSAGLQRLDGETALKVVRFRHNSDGTGYGDEDLGRIRTQQNFLKAVAKQVVSLSMLTRLDDMVRIFKQYVKTDLNLLNLAWLGKEALYAGSDGIQFATLQGTWKSPYIHTDPEKALTLINEHLNPYLEDRTLADLRFPK